VTAAHRSRERSPVRRGLGKAPVMHRADPSWDGNLTPWTIRTACGIVVDVSQASAVEADVECKGCKKVAR
jgi:hypothetical protein